ncbi:hypothetical protein Q5762_09135 [Streptomyces sp. P9(2023)]|uniref:hypothetical protein n=1 Tax=Streptomyces sp. P9(2023) TaxID=3064394 RepID=UPI0028F41099|nr:hypothetical protein [Streptomyces sp. P9(2023)]MDT9688514.1 hypothetical protein [Streptomyces sp. P9(2023)]
MRPLALSRITALAISAVITLGTAGPALADEHHPSRISAPTALAPLPDAAALLKQADALGNMSSVTTTVTDLLEAVLKADGGQIPAADAAALKDKITAAVDAAKGTVPAPLPEAPAAEAPAVQTPAEAPAVQAPAVQAPTLPVATGGAKAAKAAPADIVTDALATVEKAVAGLLAAVTSGGATGVVPQVTATLTSLVNLVVATVLGSGLPAADLAGLPTLPTLPVEAPELPVDPPVGLPAAPLPVR